VIDCIESFDLLNSIRAKIFNRNLLLKMFNIFVFLCLEMFPCLIYLSRYVLFWFLVIQYCFSTYETCLKDKNSKFGFNLTEHEKNRKNCTIRADLLFLLDISNSIDQNEFEELKINLIELIEKLDIASNNIHLGLLTFADKITLEQPLTSNRQIKFQLKNIIDDLEQDVDGRLTTKALELSKTLFSLSERALETNVTQITILFSTGRFRDSEIRFVRKEANILKSKCHLLTVGIGKFIAKMSLKMIASCPEYYLTFSQINAAIELIAAETCF
jgi:hypothetical protein